jgi:hypothetical protein
MDECVCPICGEAVPAPLLRIHMKLEKNLIREMRETNPEWFQDGQACSKCIEEYKRKHERTREEAREIRAKTTPFSDMFNSTNGDADPEEDS